MPWLLKWNSGTERGPVSIIINDGVSRVLKKKKITNSQEVLYENIFFFLKGRIEHNQKIGNSLCDSRRYARDHGKICFDFITQVCDRHSLTVKTTDRQDFFPFDPPPQVEHPSLQPSPRLHALLLKSCL